MSVLCRNTENVRSIGRASGSVGRFPTESVRIRAVPWTRCSVKQAVVKPSVLPPDLLIRLRVQSSEHLLR